MTKDKVAAYVQTSVELEADKRIQPLIQAIDGELASIRDNEDEKARLDKNSAECQERIKGYQTELAAAKKVVADLAEKLEDATDVAAE